LLNPIAWLYGAANPLAHRHRIATDDLFRRERMLGEKLSNLLLRPRTRRPRNKRR